MYYGHYKRLFLHIGFDSLEDMDMISNRVNLPTEHVMFILIAKSCYPTSDG